jgi:hypothetical protein
MCLSVKNVQRKRKKYPLGNTRRTMKTIMIEVPDNWHPHFCGLCYPHECNGARGCPVPNGKVITPIQIEALSSAKGKLNITIDPPAKLDEHLAIYSVEEQ